MAQVRFRLPAREDLLVIRRWSEAQWGDARARDFLSGLIETVRYLDQNPLMGRSRETLLTGMRSLRYRGYGIFYQIDDTGPLVLAIIHEKRHLAALDFADCFEGDDLP